MESRPERATFLRTALSSAFAAACLNLGASTLDHPRALAGFPELGLPLVAGFVLCFVGASVVLGLGGALGARLGLARGALDAALVTACVLGATLAPLVQVGLREATPERMGVVLGCATGFVLCAGIAAYALELRTGAAPGRHLGVWLVAGLPLVGAVALVTLWFFEYHAEGAWARGLAGLGAAGAFAAAVACTRRFEASRVLGALCALACAHAVVDALHGPGYRSVPCAAAPDRPPLVLITVDTLRADRVLGDPTPVRVPTPAIDALAADSVVFTQARSSAPWTKPSLATLLTGLSPLVHGVTNRRARVPQEVDTLAERLHAAGYRTGGFGLNAHLERTFGFDQGFDDYAFPARLDYGVALGARLLERWAPARFPELFPSTTAIADAAIDWLGEHAHEPFFLWMHVLDPHWPYEPPAEWLEHPEREPRRWGEPTMVTNVQAGNTKPGQAERERVQELYAGEIRYVDHELARVVAALQALGIYERALVVFASDHGEEFWEHGRYEHGHTLYDEILHVPLFFKLPGAGARMRIDAPVPTEGLLASVLDVLGLPFDPERLSSGSLAPWWRVPGSVQPAPLFSTGTYYFGEKRGVVFDGRKLVRELDTGRCELYDLAADPHELHSLAAARPDTRDEGLRLIEDWQARCARLRACLGIAVSTGDTDAETLRMLQGLGYIGND